jgi:hypothetical protein
MRQVPVRWLSLCPSLPVVLTGPSESRMSQAGGCGRVTIRDTDGSAARAGRAHTDDGGMRRRPVSV